MTEGKKPMKKIVALLNLLLLVVVGIGIFLYLSRADEQPTVVTQDIEATISDIGELATSEYRYTISQTSEKPSKEVFGFSMPLSKSSVLYSYDGVIKAGIQFSDITINVNEAQKTVYVQLPESEILSEEVFQDSLIVYDETYSPFNTFTFSDMNLSVADLKETAKNDAIKSGLLDAAHENAITIINSTVSSFYDTDEYTIEYY